MSEDIIERVKDLLAEKFELKPEEIELLTSIPTEKWMVIARPPPLTHYGIFITKYEDGRVKVDTGSIPTKVWVRKYLNNKNYARKYREAKTPEEKEKILEEKYKELERIIEEDFKRGAFEKYLKAKGGTSYGSISYCAKLHLWAGEISRRVSSKYGLEVKFEIDTESSFVTEFNSSGMDKEQEVNEIKRRIDAIAEAREMLENEDEMNEFLISRGIEPWKSRRRQRAS